MQRRAMATAGLVLALGLGLAACAPPGAADGGGGAQKDEREEAELQPDETADGFDLDALIAAAQQEGPITIYDETGKVTQIAEAFTAAYGIKAEGVKIETNAIDKVKRESSSGNIIADVLAVSDPPAVYAELLRDGILTNWVPGDVYDDIPEEARYPYLPSGNWLWWAYNTEAYGDTCPIDNVWQLTEAEWKGKVAIPDPESRAMYTNMWNQAARDHGQAWGDAYEAQYGEKLETEEPTAFHEWLKRFAANGPAVFKSDEEVSEAVGAPGQTAPPLGQMFGAKFRNNADKGFMLGACDGLDPYIAYPAPQAMGYVTKSKSPNAAKLYIHFATTQEGLDFIMGDAKMPYNTTITVPANASGLDQLIDQAMPFSTEYLEDDYRNTVTWQDLWRSNRWASDQARACW